MPTFALDELSPVDRYRLLIGSIVPRPIAWVTTCSPAGVVNLAPFSFFNGVSASPPTLMIAIAHRDPVKDTLANLRSSGEAVVHLPPSDLIDAVHQSGAAYRGEISEVERLGLATVPAERVAPPRLAAAEIAFECRLQQEVAIGSEQATTACFLEVLVAHVADAVAGRGGLPDARRLRTLARLGERAYLLADGWTLAERGKQRLADADRVGR